MKKLLIVDDEDAMRGLYRRRLLGLYEVFETGDPGQALALALEHKPDAVILDLKMPKYNGFELCRNFRSISHTADLPIFVITAEPIDQKKECEKLGATGFFEKPVDFDKLKQTLEAALKNRPTTRPNGSVLRLRVALRLTGRDADGECFAELADTESVSPEGFLCLSARAMEEGSTLDVFLAGRIGLPAGPARIVERFPAGPGRHRYRFKFEGEKKNWILKSNRK
jgi:CheY-like chemotaxis protein